MKGNPPSLYGQKTPVQKPSFLRSACVLFLGVSSWVICFATLALVKTLWIAPNMAADVEMALAGSFVLLGLALAQGPWRAFVLSLGMAMGLLLALRFLDSPLGQDIQRDLIFFAQVPKIAPAYAMPLATGLGILSFIWFLLPAHLSNKRPRYATGEFLADAQKRRCGEFILGVKRRKWFLFKELATLPIEKRALHGQVIGSSGSGKTQFTLALAYQDMLRGWPVFYLDNKENKGDFEMFLALAKKAGREKDVVRVHFNDPSSKKINIVRLPGNKQDPHAIAGQFIRVTGREPGSDSDSDFYKQLDHSRILDMVEVFLAAHEPITIRRAYEYFSDDKLRSAIFSRIPQTSQGKLLVHRTMKNLSANGADLGSLLTYLMPWTVGTLGQVINAQHPDLLIEDIFEKNLLAYIVAPLADQHLQTNALGRMLMALLLSYSQMRQRQGFDRPASVILEEFSEFVTQVFSALVSTSRSAGFYLTLSHQDLSQLRKIEDMDKDAFVGNVTSNTAGFKVFFNAVNPDDAEFMAKSFGTFTEIKRTKQIKAGLLGLNTTGNYSEREVESFFIHPNEFKTLVPFKAAIKVAGEKPCLVSTPAVYEILRMDLTPPVSLAQKMQCLMTLGCAVMDRMRLLAGKVWSCFLRLKIFVLGVLRQRRRCLLIFDKQA